MIERKPRVEIPRFDTAKPYMLFSYAGTIAGFRAWMDMVHHITRPIVEPKVAREGRMTLR